MCCTLIDRYIPVLVLVSSWYQALGHTSLVWYLIDTSVHASIDTKSLVPSTGIYTQKTEVPALFCFCCSNHGTHWEEHLQQCVQYMNGPCSGEKNLRWGVH